MGALGRDDDSQIEQHLAVDLRCHGEADGDEKAGEVFRLGPHRCILDANDQCLAGRTLRGKQELFHDPARRFKDQVDQPDASKTRLISRAR